jgi:hypothetical protein
VNECKIEENVITGIPNLRFEPTPTFFHDLQMDATDVANKIWIYSPNGTGGGIDVDTGYSYRVLAYEKYQPLIEANKQTFDNYDSFTAGTLSSRLLASRTIFLPGDRTVWIVLLIGMLLLLISLFLKH